MEIDTKYAVKLFFANSTFVQVYFEAIANALDAGANNIKVTIVSDGQISPGDLEISIWDDGEGFTEERFERFRLLSEPPDPYHKGLGRLVYLNYFAMVSISSSFGTQKREFTFADTWTGDSTVTGLSNESSGTVIRLHGFIKDRLRSYDDIKPGILKDKIIEHFLPLFHLRKKASREFSIEIQLETDEQKEQKDFFADIQKVTLADVPNLESHTFQDLTLHAFSDILINYGITNAPGEKGIFTAACIDGRTVQISILSPSALPYNCSAVFLFESALFTGKSDSARQRLILPEGVTLAALQTALRREVSAVLNEQLPEIEQRNQATKRHFEETYPHLIGLFEDNTVGLIDRNEAVEYAQRRFFKQQQEVLESGTMDERTFEKSLELSARSLTEYILYRELIIRRLTSVSEAERESVVHGLVVPRYQRFHEGNLLEGIYRNNAWLLDDKFMSFRTILSEATMSEVISAITLEGELVEDEGRPDISMIFSADPEEVEKVDVVVVELKRRKVDVKENLYAPAQLISRAQRLVDHCPAIQRVWYYAIIEIDDDLARLLLSMHWTPLFSKGRVFYQEFSVTREKDGATIPTPICISSFGAVTQDAASRNHTFLELLKSGFKSIGTT